MDIGQLIRIPDLSTLGVANTKANIAASQTDAAIITAISGRNIRVLGVVCQAGGTATTVVFNTKPAGAGTAISMTFQNGANGGVTLPFNPAGWFETVAGEGLTATTGAGSTTGIQVVYSIVPQAV